MKTKQILPLLLSSLIASTSYSAGGPPLPQQTQFLNWALEKEIEIKNRPNPVSEEVAFTEPVYLPLETLPLRMTTPIQGLRIRHTADLYFQKFGRNTIESFLWSGIESGNPRTSDDKERWNSLREEGLYDSATRHKIIAALRRTGVRNIRLGISNHEIDLHNEASWRETTAMINDFYRGGMNISLDLHHFGIEDRFRVLKPDGTTDGEKSYYLNPEWPKYFARFARRAVEKYHRQIKAVTIMNEPETVAGFNGEMWHGGFPGWNDSQSNRFYILRSLQIGKASVYARLQIEDYLARMPAEIRPHLLYVHTEASVHKTYWNEFNMYRRFLISDMILGQDWLVDSDLDQLEQMPMDQIVGRWERLNDSNRTNLDWVIQNYIVYNQQEEHRQERRSELVKNLRQLQSLHSKLHSRYGKSMKTDTVLAIDYYSHNEDQDSHLQRLNPEPQYYVDQIKQGRRVGLYKVLIEYYNHFQMPLMIGESGTPYYYYGSRWTQQVLLECAKAAAQGIPFLGYTIYPAVDTVGWESALSKPRAQALHNPSGLVGYDYNPKPFMKALVSSLSTRMGSTAPIKPTLTN